MTGHEPLAADEPAVYWRGHGADLARRMDALAHQIEGMGPAIQGGPAIAGLIRTVLNTDYNPLGDQRPQLGPPPQKIRN
jgi:hypothetical protein